ncbi:hypothetical protein [Marinobacter mobilis]|uniref:DUF4760 domain-containing protein n=1 Tax=Marinobacter mobilis TaxID=488533 RepID=A0A1H3D3M1_9GAMM|nr:hypothetical protein [Marinobacter mobilis]SDX61001.1 hypothetical protein SAMN04487960_111126 [Marinobacter mobilis]
MIAESVILVNLLVTLICVWAAMIVNSKFLRPAALNRKRFAIYELRDSLAILAMKGVVNEKSEEYVTLTRLMNNCLNSTKDFSITNFLKLQSKIVTDKKLRSHLESILEKIRNEEMPEEYRKIVSQFFEVSREIYEHKTWMLVNILRPLIFIFGFFAHGVKALRRIRNFLVYQKNRIDNIEHEIEENISKFAI